MKIGVGAELMKALVRPPAMPGGCQARPRMAQLGTGTRDAVDLVHLARHDGAQGHAVRRLQADEIETGTGHDAVLRDDKRGAFGHRLADQHARADGGIGQTVDFDIGRDAAALDRRADPGKRAGPAAVAIGQAHGIARRKGGGMAFRNRDAQEDTAAAQVRDDLSRDDDGALGDVTSSTRPATWASTTPARACWATTSACASSAAIRPVSTSARVRSASALRVVVTLWARRSLPRFRSTSAFASWADTASRRAASA